MFTKIYKVTNLALIENVYDFSDCQGNRSNFIKWKKKYLAFRKIGYICIILERS